MTTAPIKVLLHNDDTAAMAAAVRAALPDCAIAECNDFASLPAMIDGFRPDAVYTVRFTSAEPYPRDALFFEQGPRWVANGGAGTDHFGQWDPARVTVTNAAGVAADMIAEYVMGAFLHFTLDVPGLCADQASHTWNAARTVRPLRGATLLVVGLGHSGRAIAARAKAFGMRVIGTRARPLAMDGIDAVFGADALADLMPQADFVAVSTPLTPATRGLIDSAVLAAAKPGVILADVSRGGVIVPDALLAALRDGPVAAAALDVFDREPLPTDSPFWDLPNVLVSPHCSAVHDGWGADSFALFLENLKGWVAGKPLFNVVDPTRGY